MHNNIIIKIVIIPWSKLWWVRSGRLDIGITYISVSLPPDIIAMDSNKRSVQSLCCSSRAYCSSLRHHNLPSLFGICLFAMIMDVLARGIKDISPWCMLYADDIVLCGTRSDVVEKKLEEWRRAMEDRGLKINRKKTVYLRFNVDRDLDDGNSDVNIQGENLERVNTFKYLGATLAENGDLDAEMTHRIQSGWKNWKRISGILCDRRISLRVKGKVYKTVVRPAMMYGSETWAVKKAHEKKLDVAEMRMLRWMSGVTKMDRIRNERIRGTTTVGEISKKVQESRIKWYGHVSRREDEYVGKRVLGMEVPGKRRRGRPKRRWMDNIRNDLSERGLSEEDAQDRSRWRRLTRHIDPT